MREATPSDPPEEIARSGVTVLEQALWRDLMAAEDDARFLDAWLGLVLRMVPGAIGGFALLLQGDRPVAAQAPPGAPADAGMIAAARAAIEARRGTVQPAPNAGDGGRAPTRLAYPVQHSDAAIAAVVLDVDPGAGHARDMRAAMRQLQWAAAWLRERHQATVLARQQQEGARTALALELLAQALEQPSFSAACRVAATELAVRLGCERVSLGLRQGRRSVVAAISHSAGFGRKMALVRRLANAMDEAVDQRRVVLHPPPDAADAPLGAAHAALAGLQEGGQVLTVPMLVQDRFVGAATLERPAGAPFDQAAIDLAEAVVAILGPALLDKRENDRMLPVKIAQSARRQANALFGPGHWGMKLAVLGLVGAALFAQFAHGTYHIRAEARLEGQVRRTIAAPFDGFVAEAPARAGDTVRAGQMMAVLDDRDLVLERLRWVTERGQHLAEYDQALARGQRAEAGRFRSLIDQAEAQIRLVDAHLARTRLAAPLDGMVVSGDLSQSIGAPVRRGEALFEIAPLDSYRVELRVHESQIAETAVGQTGALLVSALPGRALGFTVERVTPVAEARDGRMTFRVDARLDESEPRLRPGMEGVGHVDAGRARLIWIWTRALQHWVRVTVWSWVP